jgi:hypothetical protein
VHAWLSSFYNIGNAAALLVLNWIPNFGRVHVKGDIYGAFVYVLRSPHYVHRPPYLTKPMPKVPRPTEMRHLSSCLHSDKSFPVFLEVDS